jgi:hypothetical protein
VILELNKQDAAAWLEISAPTLDRWIKNGKVQVRRIAARIGQQSIIVLLEVPDVAPTPAPAPEPATPEPTQTETPDAAHDYMDSMGNGRMTPKDKKISLLGPNPELPQPEVVQDAAAKWDEWRTKFSPAYTAGSDAAGPLAGRPNFYSKSEQQKRAAHDRAVIAASFPRGEKR